MYPFLKAGGHSGSCFRVVFVFFMPSINLGRQYFNNECGTLAVCQSFALIVKIFRPQKIIWTEALI